MVSASKTANTHLLQHAKSYNNAMLTDISLDQWKFSNNRSDKVLQTLKVLYSKMRKQPQAAAHVTNATLS